MSDDDEFSPGSQPGPKVSRVPQKVAQNHSPVAPIALLVALIAVGLAVWALVSAPKETTSAQQPSPGDSKGRVCEAAQTVAMAVQLQTNSNLGTDPAAVESVAANARLAMLGGGDYLLSQIDANTPADLADDARSFGSTLRLIGVNALAGLPNTDEIQSGRIRDAEASRNKLAELCTR